jgi:hypothetical protein
MLSVIKKIWRRDDGQEITALMLSVVLLLALASVSAIGTHANTIFNSAATHLTAS